MGDGGWVAGNWQVVVLYHKWQVGAKQKITNNARMRVKVRNKY